MTVAIVIIIIAFTFLFGFFCGIKAIPTAKPVLKRHYATEDGEIERLRKEYSNFLSYDGTEQSDINLD